MDRESKRDEVVRTAYALFNRHGYRAVGVDRIIAEAGVAKMTMYRHFSSKDDLVVAVLLDRRARFERALDALAERSSSPGEEVAAIVRWYGEWFRRPAFHGCVFARALGEYDENTGGGAVFAAAAGQKAAFRDRMERIVGDLGHPRPEAGVVAAALVAAVEGATVLARAGTTQDAAAALALTVERLLGVGVVPT